MEPTQFSSEIASQFSKVYEVMQDIEPALSVFKETDLAVQILGLRQHYQRENPRYFECIKSLQSKNTSWISLEFLKATPATHLSIQKLKELFELTSKVYLASNKFFGGHVLLQDPSRDYSQELATWLYEILKQIEHYEADAISRASTAKGFFSGTVVSTVVGLVNPLLAPVGLVAAYVVKRITTSEPTLQDRRRIKPVEFIKISDYVRYMFEPESSGLYGRHIKQNQSYTLGELEIQLEKKIFRCFFNLSNKHKISPTDLCRLHMGMLEDLKEQISDPQVYLDIIEVLTNVKIPRGTNVSEVASFLDPELLVCLDDIKQRCVHASRRVAYIPDPKCIIDVSGYKNGCGLYSLALASKIAVNNANGPYLCTLPDSVLGWDKSWLQSTNHDPEILEPVHNILRAELAEALLQDSEFKQNNETSFISACTSYLSGENYPVEMKAFFESNLIFLDQLNTLAQKTPFQLTSHEKVLYTESIQSERAQITSRDILLMTEQLLKYFNTTPKPWVNPEVCAHDFGATMDSYFKETLDPINRIIQQKKLFDITWVSCPTLEQRNWWRAEAGLWLENKLSELSRLASEPNKLSLIKLFGFLSSAFFEGDGTRPILPKFDDFIDRETLRFLITASVKQNWQNIFANYVAYIKNESCLLTADELYALAKKWNINLSIFEWNNYSRKPNQLRVCLTNPSKDHWQVYTE